MKRNSNLLSPLSKEKKEKPKKNIRQWGLTSPKSRKNKKKAV